MGLVCCFSLLAGAVFGGFQEEQKKKYGDRVRSLSLLYGVDPELVHAIIVAESNYDPGAVSRRGAVGLMQLMPETAGNYGVLNAFDPDENLKAGIRYLRDLIRTYDSDLDRVLAAYNAGPEALKKYGGIPPYPETKRYLKKVKAIYGGEGQWGRTKIFIFRDGQGRITLTNDKHYYNMNKKGAASGSSN